MDSERIFFRSALLSQTELVLLFLVGLIGSLKAAKTNFYMSGAGLKECAIEYKKLIMG
jgi:hypothetical protein